MAVSLCCIYLLRSGFLLSFRNPCSSRTGLTSRRISPPALCLSFPGFSSWTRKAQTSHKQVKNPRQFRLFPEPRKDQKKKTPAGILLLKCVPLKKIWLLLERKPSTFHLLFPLRAEKRKQLLQE